MSGTSNFSHYHPSWESRDFTREEYKKLLEKLANKPSGNVYMTDNDSIRLAGRITYIWQTIKGWFGFENKTDPVKVNYEFLKLLRYGETHHFFSDEKISALVAKLAEVLAKEKQHAVIAEVISKTLRPSTHPETASSLIDREVQAYYTDHRTQLHEAFWPQLFHRCIAPFTHTVPAGIHFNTGRIHASEGRHAQAVASFQRALELSPHKQEWHLAFISSALKHADALCTQGKDEDALTACTQALKSIKAIHTAGCDPLLANNYRLAAIRTYAALCALHVKEGRPVPALEVLKEGTDPSVESNLMDAFETVIRDNPGYLPGKARLGEFYIFLARDVEGNNKIPFLEKAVAALGEIPLEDLTEDSASCFLNAALELSALQHKAGALDKALKQFFNAAQFVNKIYTPFIYERSSPLIIDRFYQSLTRAADSLVAALQETDAPGAIKILLEIQEKCRFHDIQKYVEYCDALAALYIKTGKPVEAFKQLEHAFEQTSSPAHAEKLKNLACQIAQSLKREGRIQDSLAFLEKGLKVASTDWMLLQETATAQMALADWSAAHTSAQRLLRSHPGRIESHLLASQIHSMRGQTREALLHAREAIKIAPENPEAILQLFKLTGTTGDANISRVIEICQKALADHPADTHLHVQLANLYMISRNVRAARQQLEEADRLNPNNADVEAAFGKLCMLEEKPAQALQHFQKARTLSRNPDSFAEELYSCRTALAAKAFSDHHTHDMLEHYRHALRVSNAHNNEVANSLVAAADMLYGSNKPASAEIYQAALPLLTQELIGSDKFVNIYLRLAAYAKEQRSYSNAIAHLQNARRLAPGNNTVLQELAGCLAAGGDAAQAQAIYQALAQSGHAQTDSYASLAALHFRNREFDQALAYYRQAAASSSSSTPQFKEEIYSCLVGLAAQLESTHRYVEAIPLYKEALELAAAAQKKEVAGQLLLLGSRLRSSHADKAREAYALAIPYASQVTVDPQYTVQAYVTLGLAAKQIADLDRAIQYFQNAVTLDARNHALLTELGDLHSLKGNLELAAQAYRSALTVQPSNMEYMRKLVAVEIELGNQCYARGIHDPQQMRQIISDAVKYFREEAPYRQNILRALGAWSAWMGESSQQKALRLLGTKTSIVPQQLEADARSLINLLKTAYDGQANHLARERMPDDLRLRIISLERQLENLKFYYSSLQLQTNAAVTTAQTAGLTLFSGWTGLWPTDDLSQANQIVTQARQVLQRLQGIPSPAPAIKAQIELLKQMLSPAAWMHQAIAHYSRVIEMLPNQYGEHCNKLIDAYAKAGDFLSAVLLFEQLKAKFPSAPLSIDPRAYSHVVANAEQRNRLTAAQMYAGLVNAGQQQESDRRYAEAIESYKSAIAFASSTQVAPLISKLILIGDNLLHEGSSALAVTAYEIAIPHLNKLSLTPAQRVNIYSAVAQAARDSRNYDKAVAYYREALTLAPANPALTVALADVYYTKNEFELALEGYQRAARLQPGNAGHTTKLVQLYTEVGHQYYARGLLHNTVNHLKALINQVVTTAQAARVQTALDDSRIFGFGGSGHYNTFRNLGTATTLQQVQTNTQQAIQILELAYDGRGRHLKPEEMPAETHQQILALKQLQTALQDAHSHLPAMASTPAQPAHTVADWMNHAMTHYAKASELTESYGIYCNRLIDAHVQMDNHSAAVNTFEFFKAKFPASPLRLNPQAYISMAQEMETRHQLIEAVNLLKKAIGYFPDEPLYKKALSHIYGVIAINFDRANNNAQAFKYFTLALNCGVEAEASCYAGFANLYHKAWKAKKNLETNADLREDEARPENDERRAYLRQTAQYRKKAADLAPHNAAYQYAFGLIGYRHQVLELDPVLPDYFRKAVLLDPTNANYAQGHVESLVRRYSNSDQPLEEIPEGAAAISHLQSLNVKLTDLWEDGASLD